VKGIIVPALIAKNQEELDELIRKLPQSTTRVMLDFMDGFFVPNHSLDFDLKLPTGWTYEAHLMVSDPRKYVKQVANMVDIIIFHYESVEDHSSIIKEIKKFSLQTYIAINPETKTEAIMPLINDLDGVLVMTVNPGKYGSKFIKDTLKKVKKLRQIKPELSIEVDGGMNPENALKAASSGANIIASGSYIMKSENPEEAYKALSSVFS
jgi:ribulose-phosphate 3-epimerase